MDSQSFQFIMREGPSPGKVFTLSRGEISIGRDTSNDIVINVAEVSRKHARLILKGGGYVLEDLGSTNGTFVNGQRIIAPHVLRPGDVIMLGDAVSLEYQSSSYDPNATMISTTSEVGVPAQAPAPAPAAKASAPAAPSYAGSVPAAPAAPLEQAPKKRNTWLLAGIGCLVIACILIVVGAFLFDYFNMYCTPPFNALFACP